MALSIIAAVLFSLPGGNVEFKVESSSEKIDPGRSVVLTVEARAPRGVEVSMPDLRPRVRGFSLADRFPEEPVENEDGSVTRTEQWLLVPEPCAKTYKIAPFAVEVKGGDSFVAGPVYFTMPDPVASPGGDMQIGPEKDLPPFSWMLFGEILLAVLAAAAVLAGLLIITRKLFRRVSEHFKSPIERAWAELDRLVKKGLPMRGRYKDFYVELTMVVRRYIDRKYGIRAPHLTTEEFFEKARESGGLFAAGELRQFMENADLVKFAGVEATVSMADGATDSARDYLKRDSAERSAPDVK